MKRRKSLSSLWVERLEDRTLLTLFNVISLNDDGSAGTLRSQIQEANSNPGPDEIVFESGLSGRLSLTSGALQITDALTITGISEFDTVISGDYLSRVFDATLATGNVTFNNLTVDSGIAESFVPGNFTSGGGGIRFLSTGTLSLSHVTVSNNFAAGPDAQGGGIFANNGPVVLTDSKVINNGADGPFGFGGGISSDAGITVTNSTISGNMNIGQGGSGAGLVSFYGPITVNNSQILANTAQGPGSAGGGIWTVAGAITVTDSTIDGNRTPGATTGYGTTGGGGIYSVMGAVTIMNSTVSNNISGNTDPDNGHGSRGQGGGAIFVRNAPGSITLINSTVSGNETPSFAFYGAGLSVLSASIKIVNSTVTNNYSKGDYDRVGGGVFAQTGNVTIQNSIIAKNRNVPQNFPDSGTPDLNPGTGTLTITNSLIGDNTGISGTFSGTGLTPDSTNHNLIGTKVAPIDPLLNALADNGSSSGTLLTHSLKPGSPAIDRGSSTLALDSVGSPLATDERGSGFLRNSGLTVDMGAFEIQSTQPKVNSIAIPPGSTNPTSDTSVTFNVTFNKAVTGVTASQFVVLTTGNVQSGTPEITALSGSSYRVTVPGITGAGTLGLNLLDSAQAIKSTVGNETLLQSSVTGAVYTIVAARTLGVQSIVRADGASNPTSDSSVSFQVTFNEGVTGVAANQFTPTLTGTVQAGTVSVTAVGDAVYTVTVSGVSGAGTLGLNFQDDGNVFSKADHFGVTQSTFTTGAVYNIVESSALSVQSIAFANGFTSPTSASSVSFTVTFSAGVINVAASQFSVATTGTVASGTPQLTVVSDSVYTVTVGGITGAGSLGLNFQDDGTVHRKSDNLAMTQTSRVGAAYTIVQGTQGTTDLHVGGLQFHVVGGGNFTIAGSNNSATGQVQVGFDPTGGNPFTPLATLNGTVTIDTSALSFSATGSLVAILGGTERQLFNQGVSNVSITQLLGSGASTAGGTSLSVAGSTFTLSSFAFSSTSQPTIKLQGTAVLPKGISVAVDGNNFVQISTSGISLNGASFTLTNSFSVAGVTFSADQLTVGYSTTGNVFTLTGTAGVTVRDIGNLSVNFSGTGLVINNGVFSSLDATVNGSFLVKGVGIAANALHFSYAESTQQFSLSGTASVTVGGLDDSLSVTFGHGNTPGLVVTNGSLVSLDMTVNAEFHVAKVTVSATNLEFTYTASTQTFTLSGTAGFTIGGVDDSLSVTFGHGNTPGLVITNGSLVSLDVTVNATFHVARVTVTATDLEFTYVAASKTFTLTGTAGLTISGIDDNLSVTFGHAETPGLIVTDGSLVSLDVTVNATFHIAKVTVTATDLRFTYTAASRTFTLAGTAGFTVSGIDNSLSVTFGHGSTPGLVIADGALVSLDVTVNATFNVKKVTITATNLEFTYVTASNRFTLSGTAGIKINGVDDSLSVTFGHGNTPGLVITNGSLVSLDITVNAVFHVSKVTISATNLEFTYTAATSTFTLSGTAGVNVGNFGANLSVTFGHAGAPGLVIVDGTLERLDMTVNAGFRVAQVLDVNVVDLNFTYTRSTNQFTLSGGVRVSPVGIGDLANLSATFGDVDHPGLVIQNGNLVSLHLDITANLRVSALTVSGQLSLDYTHSTRTILISGVGSIAVAGIGSLNVHLGGGGTQGLVIVNGAITTFNMTIDTRISLAGLTLNGNLIMNYSSFTRVFTMTGDVSLNIGSIGNVTARLGGNGTTGLVVSNGSLSSLDMLATANFSVGPLTVNGSLVISYQQYSGRFVMYGTATGGFFGNDFFTLVMGNSSQPGMDIRNGSLYSLSVTASGRFTILGVPIGNASLTANYNSGRGEFYFAGRVSADLPDFVPDWLASAMGGRTIGSLDVVIDVIANNNRDSYVQLQIGLLGQTFGFKKPFEGGLTFIGNSPLTTIFNGAIVVGNAIADGAVTVGNAIASAATDAWNWFSSWWGPLEGAMVFYDAGFNFDLANDPQSITGADGRFAPVVPQGATTGQIVVVGGFDRSTGLTNFLRLTAPYNARVVSPLTSLINELMQQRGLSPNDAITVVDQALGLPITTNLLVQSLALDATGGDLQSARAFSREVQVGTIVHQVASLLSGLPGAPSIAELSTTGFAAVASIVGESAGIPLDLSNSALILEIIERTAQDAELDLDLDFDVAAGAATVIAGVNGAIDALELTDATTYLNRLLQIQTVTQGTIAPQLAQVTAGQVSIETVVSENTGAALTSQTNNATFGILNAIGPTISITPAISQAVGVGDPADFSFQVYLSSPEPLDVPVSVDYVVASQSATVAHGDFDQSFGTLTWQPGDTAPKTVNVRVHATNSDIPNRLFTVELSKPVHAEIVNIVGIGTIAYSDFATTTQLVSAAPAAEFGDAITFTATVTNLDPAHTIPQTGMVTFFDGNQFLGSSPVINGVATFTTSTLSAVVHQIKASYSGVMLTAENYLPSVSDEVEQVVGQLSQSIEFPSLANVTTDVAPFVINAFSSSGLPLVYKVISGSVTMNQDILTVNGPGLVILEAGQPGNDNFTSATPVTQTFFVTDSGTGNSNSAPVAKNGIAKVAPGASVQGQLTATDAENDSLTFGVGIDPQNGTVLINEDGSFEYTPVDGFSGIDTFTFTANDGQLVSNIATISVTVADPNLAPVARNGVFEVQENSSQEGSLSATTGNSGTLTYSLGSRHAQHGQLAIHPDGTFTYTPFQGYAGIDSFSFIANDGHLSSAEATIEITVNALPPVAQDLALEVQENGSQNGTFVATGGHNALTFLAGVVKAHHGTVTIQPDGSFLYVPARGFFGTDSFSYIAKDGDLTSNEGTVSVTVNEVIVALVAENGTLEVQQNVTQGGTLSATGGNGGALTFSAGSILPRHGTLTINPNGTFTYVPARGFFGTDSFSFVATDGQSTSPPGTISVTIHKVNTSAFEVTARPTAAINTKGATRLDSVASLTNVTAGTNFTSAKITVTVFNTGGAKDTLSIAKGGAVTLKGKKVFVNGVQVGILAGGKSGIPLTVTLNAGSEAAINALLKSVSAKAGKVKKGLPQSVRSISISVAAGETHATNIETSVS